MGCSAPPLDLDMHLRSWRYPAEVLAPERLEADSTVSSAQGKYPSLLTRDMFRENTLSGGSSWVRQGANLNFQILAG